MDYTEIPNIQQWRLATNGKIIGKLVDRGGNMAVIDAAVDNYTVVRGMDGQPLSKIAAEKALAIAKACNSWLKLKQGKKETYTFFGKPELFARRKTAISALCKIALKRFATFSSATAAERARNKAAMFYAQNKLATVSRKSTDKAMLTKQLNSAYSVERQTWVDSGKTTNISGSFVHGVHHAYHRDEGFLTTTGQKLAVPADLAPSLAKQGDELTEFDWAQIKSFALKNGLENTTEQNQTECKYLKVDQRFAQLIMYDDAGLMINSKAEVLNIKKVTEMPPIYVMDRYGSLYTDMDLSGVGGRFVNHSTVLAGNEVICAGNLEIDKGLLKTINNNSGHYKPDRENLRQCVKVLMESGVKPAVGLKIVLYTFTSRGSNQYVWHDMVTFVNGGPANRML